MSACIPCGTVSKSEQNVIKYYMNLYKEKGFVSYVYRLYENGPIKIVEQKSFEIIFKESIKPNFKNGAEYFSIQEFKG